MNESQVEQVRSFNREVTRRVGALGDDYLGRGRPFGESRVLFEIGREGADIRDLRTRLALDSGYLSRLLRSLEAQGLATSQRAADDGRARRVTLTRKGVREVDKLDRRSQDFATSLLAPLGVVQRERMIAAMAEVERCMRASAVVIEPGDPSSADARTCIEAYFRELDARFDGGFDPGRGPPSDAADYVPPNGLFLVARLDGRAVGCGALRATARGVGEIKRMWVATSARGLGVAQRMIESLEQHAVRIGLDRLQLDTNRTLSEARALYLRNGYREIDRYNDNPHADYWFEKRGLLRRALRS
jgi:DNA-binding MarR family transcriptional regulator/GNAT superfamily N-acetyltransferase